MPGQRPNIVMLYRIVHIDNVEYLLTHGIYTRHHENADPNYINIGDSSLITQRNITHVGINPPGGSLGDYIPFYFGPLSPMLLNIKTGYRGITQRPQSDIIYICCNLQNIVDRCNEWCFTNGHAKDSLTDFFNHSDGLDEVYWNAVGLRYWTPIEGFEDRQVRKQAEFLVKDHVPVTCITDIVVYTEQKRILVQEIVDRLGLNIPVHINTEYYYY